MKGPPHPHPVLKSGRVTTDNEGLARIVFTKPFHSCAYGISVSPQNPATMVTVMWDKKLMTGFDIKTADHKGNEKGDVIVDWIAVYYGNSEE